ncbi:hypothetical protein [Paraburkholderia hayleyella]|nr:hypothetical protein [Paraburkholderia hayleyella]
MLRDKRQRTPVSRALADKIGVGIQRRQPGALTRPRRLLPALAT